MTKIKICGLKREKDISYANTLKIEFAGFVFAESKRQVDKYLAKELIKKLDKNIEKVGVFLNMPADEVKIIAEYCNLDILQFHGSETKEYCNSFAKYKIWKSFGIKDKNSLKKLEGYNTDGFLLDTYVKGQYGGTGETFNWDIVSNINYKNIILAGGLTNQNVRKAVQIVKPMIIDVSSGVEVDGYKNFIKMKKFVEEVRR